MPVRIVGGEWPVLAALRQTRPLIDRRLAGTLHVVSRKSWEQTVAGGLTTVADVPEGDVRIAAESEKIGAKI